MKNITKLIVISLISTSSFVFAQKGEYESSMYENIINTQTIVKYQLYPTKDKRIFLKLNTQNGLIWQAKFDIEGDDRNETHLNTLALVDAEGKVNNRFTLYPTSNIYTFILMDQIDGRMWQVHWSEKSEERAIVTIE